MQEEFDKIKKEFDSTRKTLGMVLNLLEKMQTAMSDGFNQVNERLSHLEGEKGMQGVTSQLFDIKSELHKIQKAYPYDDLSSNMDTITGQA